MHSAVLSAEGFDIQDVEIPQIRPDEVLVRAISCGVCSGDLFKYRSRSNLGASQVHLGHEASGEVVAVGAKTTRFAVGDLVTSFSTPAYSDFFVGRETELANLPSSVSPQTALGEPIACCMHAARRFGIMPGDRVAMVGVGFMGLICQQIAAYQGATSITAFDLVDYRRNMALELGAETTHDPTQLTTDLQQQLRDSFDVVIESAGSQSALNLCTDLVKEHGRIVLIGYHQSNQGMRNVNMQLWNYKALDVVNGHVRRADEKLEAMKEGIALMANGHIITEPLIEYYDLADIDTAFRQLDSQREGLFKAVVRMTVD